MIVVQPDYKQFYHKLLVETCCTGYFFTPTPLIIDSSLLERLNMAVPALLNLLDTPEYFNHCIAQQHWSLPVQPMKRTDFTGCADFLLTESGAKLIEMNINLPGKVGLMQLLGETAQACLGEQEGWVNLDFNKRLLETIREAIPVDVAIAIVVSHLPASVKHQAHYRYFSEQLNQLGLNTTIVQANELEVTPHGFTTRGQEFQAIINLVIPFVWEGNPAEFEQLTHLWENHSDVFFPNPTGGMFGTKDLLSYLNDQRSEPNASRWSDFVLRAHMLSEFDTLESLLAVFDLSEMVLKPLKDYDTKGVYVQPDMETLEHVFLHKKEGYMVQEFTDSLHVPFLLPSGEGAETHSVIFRMFFGSKEVIGYQGYFIRGEFNGEYYTGGVLVES